MIITDYNNMSTDELQKLYESLKIEFEINDGKIIGTIKEEIPTDR